MRWFAIAYVDLFRGLPAIVTIYLVGFGLPQALPGIFNDNPVNDFLFGSKQISLFQLGVISLTLVYGAYVAEVFRSGIESVHWSQTAAARSLGLAHGQTMRFVVVPQAVRRVVPPLLNDFIGLQKDTALVSVIGALEGFNQARIYAGQPLQPLVRHRARDLLRRDHDPDDPVHRLARRARPTPHAGQRVSDGADPFVELRDVEKRFGDHVVLKGINLEVTEHEVVCLIGASGSGKSTLLRCINGLEPIQQGEVIVDGRLGHPARRRASTCCGEQVGIVFQSYNLFPHMTVLENVTLGAAQGAEALEGRGAQRAPSRCSPASACGRSATRTPTSSPAASSSGSRSSARWRCSRG